MNSGKKKGLGRGLSALFGDSKPGSERKEVDSVTKVSISDLSRNPYQPRQIFKEEKLESKLPLKELRGYNIMHDLGIAITYTRRYALGAAYGIGSEEDDDAMSLTQSTTQSTAEKEDRIKRTPSKPNDEGEPIESIEDKNYGNPIAKPVLDVLVKKIMNLSQQYPDKKDEVLNKYKKQYGITAEKIGPADIRTAEQGKFLTLLINEIDSTL